MKRATQLARRVVTEYGMSALGPMTYGEREEMVFLGRDLVEHRNYSDETAAEIDAEVRRILETARAQAEAVLRAHGAPWERVARELIQKETIEQDAFRALMAGTPRGGAAHEAPPEPSPLPPAKPRAPRRKTLAAGGPAPAPAPA